MDTTAVKSAQQSITIRIVFDGAPYAGKTTAAYSLSEALGEVAVTPSEEPDGRTAWFDWVTYTGGRHEGKAIRVELVTVPGQDHLNDRRRHLLQWGDVVVFVADTAAGAIENSVTKFDELRSDLDELGDLPIVVIANKRDVDDAIALDDVRQRLALDDETSLIEGVATTGGGIRQAFIFAVRAALRQTSDRVEQTTANDLLDEMEAALLLHVDADDTLAPSTAVDPKMGDTHTPTEPAVETVNETHTPTEPAVETVNDTDTPTEPAVETVNETHTPTESQPETVNETHTPTEPAVETVNDTDTPTESQPEAVAPETTLADAAVMRLKSGAVPDGTSVVLYPIHWDVVAAVANGHATVPTTSDSPEDRAAHELLDWGLITAEVPGSSDSTSAGEPPIDVSSPEPAEVEQNQPRPSESEPHAAETFRKRDGSAARQARAAALAADADADTSVANTPVRAVAPTTATVDPPDVVPLPDARPPAVASAAIHPYAQPASLVGNGPSVEHRNDRYKALRVLRSSLRN